MMRVETAIAANRDLLWEKKKKKHGLKRKIKKKVRLEETEVC